jgi:hypothetical protein
MYICLIEECRIQLLKLVSVPTRAIHRKTAHFFVIDSLPPATGQAF